MDDSDNLAVTAMFYLFLLGCLSGLVALVVVWFRRRAGALFGLAGLVLMAAAFALGWLAGI